ncbi:phosphocholine cytidylyltransferase family protein [Streptomyces sp. PTD5-9]|uniref:phosphocholine cytidylyltransferase family protein n=1 Tax=Streptomyces sp. PTD5-9 TaxID=3120150 RepID=UPI0030093339
MAPLGLDAAGLEAFCRTAITGREHGKALYASWVSAALEAVRAQGLAGGISGDEVRYLRVDEVLAGRPGRWPGLVARRRAHARVRALVELPDVITGPDVLDCFARGQGRGRSMRAVILAAGRGSRLGPLSDSRPKPLLSLAGIPLLTRLLHSLNMAGCHLATLVTGYRAGELAAHVSHACTVHNPDWEHASIAASLLAAADAGALDHGAIVTYGDIVVEPRVFTALMAAPPADVCPPVNTRWLPLWQARMSEVLDDAERLLTAPDGRLLAIGGRPSGLGEVHAQFMGILRLSPAGARDLTAFYRAAVAKDPAAAGWDTTTLLAAWLTAGGRATTVPACGGWLEIDTPHDRDVYEQLHADGRLAGLCDLSTTVPALEGDATDV